LNCGNLYKNRDAFEYQVEKFSDIQNKIIPFFNKNRIQGIKSLDYQDWCKAAELIKNKAHLTEEGLDQIHKAIKAVLRNEQRKKIFSAKIKVYYLFIYVIIRFDQLMSFCWTILLPVIFSFIILVPCILYNFNVFVVNISLF